MVVKSSKSPLKPAADVALKGAVEALVALSVAREGNTPMEALRRLREACQAKLRDVGVVVELPRY